MQPGAQSPTNGLKRTAKSKKHENWHDYTAFLKKLGYGHNEDNAFHRVSERLQL